jgi:hypothetical protein
MKDILSLAVFAATVSGLMVFVNVLTPGGSIGVLRTSTKPVDCRIARSGMQECDVNVWATASQATANHALQARALPTAK